MERREFIKKTTATGSLLSGMSLTDLIQPKETKAVVQTDYEQFPLGGYLRSNDPELIQPAPLDAKLSTQQVRDVVWLALDRDTSSRSLINIVNKNSWVVIKPNIVTVTFWQHHNPNRHPDPEGWGLVTDLRVVKALVEYLIERIGPRRITIAEGPAGWYKSEGKLKKDKFIDGWNCTIFCGRKEIEDFIGVEPILHQEIQPVIVRELNQAHPITKGIKTFFFNLDEQFDSQIKDPSTTTQLFRTLAVHDKRNALGGWCLSRGNGRVVGLLPGHYPWTYREPGYREIFWRSAHWAMKQDIPLYPG